MISLFITLGLGFILGVKHAFEADHVLAVSTIVSEQKNSLKAALVGVFWGLGHTTTLFIMGIIILLLKLSIPEKLALSFELFVGIMLVILGFRTVKNFRPKLHAHGEHEDIKSRKHSTSYLIGMVHGLAGSGALVLLVLSTISSFSQGVYYILFFGLGSTLGMTMMSFLIGLPFSFSASRFPSIEKKLQLLAGILSIGFGMFIIYQITLIY